MQCSRRLTLLACLAVGIGVRPGAEVKIAAQPLSAPATATAAPEASPDFHPGDRVIRLSKPTAELSVMELQSQVIATDGRIRLVDDFNPQTISVTALSPTQLRIRGEMPGVTTLRIADEFDQVYRLEIMVEKDLRELEANLRRLFPGAAIEVLGVKDDIVLRGWVTQPNQIPRIVDLAKTYSPSVQNHIEIGGGSQVQLSCKVMEVNRSKMEQLGFNFLSLGQRYYFASTPGGLAPVASATLPFGGPPTVLTQNTALANATQQFAILGSSDIFRGFIEALKQEALLKILAEPTVTTTSGRPAELHSGGEFPILVPQGVGTATIQFRQFGIRLEAVPIVLGNGRVQLDISAEVSERDFSNSVDVSGTRVPGLTSRDVNTRVEMSFGETFMIGGLTQDRLVSSTNKVPLLGDIPYLGLAFSRKNTQVATSELIILVTPHLSAPMPPGQVPCNGPGQNSDTATCREFFVNGHMEVPRYSGGGACPPGACPPGMIGPGAGPITEFQGMPTPDMTNGVNAVGPYGGDVQYAPAMEYAPGLSAPSMQYPNATPDQPMLPPPGPDSFQSPPPSMMQQPPLPVGPAAWPQPGPSPAVGGDYRSTRGVRTISADEADLQPAYQNPPTGPSPGMIQPSRTITRPAPQFIGSGGVR
ncbi:MAG: pilus assembly protein N-terminal domain-containing protein [Planctomycetaceae bacterium]|nr:pilus assembly protein N-terminal domain-containing protein [Planctomycetaceae bacterium]